ncbi:RNA polymerase subunit sigma-70 [Rhodohalobacter mucosus]|uniref:RNA polymerase subunit sigma-70 n=2 Tax=Rhodohalobacter mucosus TaxID=2079485 RepID=A0A316TST3_9BACT|nr:RNA polymerase subunit sigma-70 [Rhodohalobacter mucosus]
MSITLRYADSRNEGAQILNDAFLKVFENISSYDTERPFKPWFRRIVLNTAINHYHKTQRDSFRNHEQFSEGMSPIESTVISAISYRELIEIIQQLSPGYRMVFNLYVIEGYTHREVADQLNITEGTSKSNLYKAKQNLRILLNKNINQEKVNESL